MQRTFLKDKKSNPVAYAVIAQLVVSVISLIFAVKSGFILPDGFYQVFVNFLLMVFIYTFSTILTFKTIKIVEASEYTILIFTRAFWSVAIAIIFLSEQFTQLKILGAILIFLSVVLVSWKRKGVTFGKGEAYGLLAAFLLGVGFVNDAIVLNSLGFWTFMVLAFGLPPLLTLLILPKSFKDTYRLMTGKEKWQPVIMGLLFFCSGSTTYLALEAGKNPGQIAALSPVAVILVVIMSAIFLKERDNLLKKFIAALICFGGIVLLS